MVLMLLQFAIIIGQAVQLQPGGGITFQIAAAHADATTDISTALGASDPFTKVGTKFSTMLTSATKVAIPILAFAIFCLAVAMFKGRIDPNKAITIMAGGIIVGSALAIATWIIS